MRKQNDKATLSNPLGLSAANELIKDALRIVGEISELRLPADQRVRIALRVAELETYTCSFRQQTPAVTQSAYAYCNCNNVRAAGLHLPGSQGVRPLF